MGKNIGNKANSKIGRKIAPQITKLILLAATFATPSTVFAAKIDAASLTADFAARDAMPETRVPKSKWYEQGRFDSWGPHASEYPAPNIPSGSDPIEWQRARVIAVAEKYIGLPYKHHHIPAWSPDEGPGLDCSNFTSWVYNYGLGMKLNSDVHKQAEGPKAPGRRLNPGEPFVAGDLLYILKNDRPEVSHVVIYIDEGHVIDSHDGSVQIREFKGWYRTHLSHARRIVE
jgi:hypothetical protein